MENTVKITAPRNTKTVSVKLDNSTQSDIEQKAMEAGITVSDYLRQIIKESKAQITKEAPLPVITKSDLQSLCSIDEESLLIIADVVTKAVKGSVPQSIEVLSPATALPERDFLRKISGLPPENSDTLSIEEETYLSTLKEAITVDVREGLLLKENSIAFPLETNNGLQKEMLKSMIEKRESISSEKVPSLTKVFQNAITEAFFNDAEKLYNSHLFKATYGMEYKEFKAVYQLD